MADRNKDKRNKAFNRYKKREKVESKPTQDNEMHQIGILKWDFEHNSLPIMKIPYFLEMVKRNKDNFRTQDEYNKLVRILEIQVM